MFHQFLAKLFRFRTLIKPILLDLPNEVLLHIASMLPCQDLNRLVQANVFIARLLSPVLLQHALTVRVGWQRRSVLHWAAAHNRLSLVTQLLGGVGVDTRDSMGMTALHSCVLRRHLGAVEALLRAGACPNIASYLGWTPLLLVACSGDSSIAEVLLRNGAAVDSAPPSTGAQNALHHAAALGHGAVVEVLLAMGCEKGARDVHGVDALRSAELFGRGTVVERLEEVGGFGGDDGGGHDGECSQHGHNSRSVTATRYRVYMYERCLSLDRDDCRECLQARGLNWGVN